MFIIGIGGELSIQEKHDVSCSGLWRLDYSSENGLNGLNGDLLVWNDILGRSFEPSSMGISVDKEALIRQLFVCADERKTFIFINGY